MLKNSFFPFFCNFGTLLPVQIEVIPKILNGNNLVICSPTASGKTEAVMAPICEKIQLCRSRGLKVLYITPTKALANDLRGRLTQPLADMCVTIDIKTGDRPFDCRKSVDILVTTPESFDSLLCRHPEIFSSLRFVVLDELHLLDGTYRGDQLRLLLKRLDQIAGKMQTIILSATLADPKEVAKRYVDDFEISIVKDQKEIEYELIDLDSPSMLQSLADSFKAKRIQKALFFCNTREQTEKFAQLLESRFNGKVGVHHSNITKSEREKIEKALREGCEFYVVATTTLEVGIDIGEIEAVCLVHPPLSISSLLQRIGRGCRRKKRAIAYGLYRGEEREMFETMFEKAKRGDLEKNNYVPSASVLVQQIFSMLYEKRHQGLAKQSMLQILKHLNIDSKDLDEILSKLQQSGYVILENSQCFPSTKLLDLGERGLIHSNIPDEKEVEVIDVSTGRPIGKVCYEPTVSSIIALNGKIWKVEKLLNGKIYVSKSSGSQEGQSCFSRRQSQGKFFMLLPESVKKKFSTL